MMKDFSGLAFTDRNINHYYEEIKSTAIDDLNFMWLGIQDYNPILKLQRKIQKDNIKGDINNIVLLLEHNHVYTLGKNADKNHILPLQDRCSNKRTTSFMFPWMLSLWIFFCNFKIGS